MASNLSIYLPKRVDGEKLDKRLERLAKVKDRSVNYLVVEAIQQYLAREEKRKPR